VEEACARGIGEGVEAVLSPEAAEEDVDLIGVVERAGGAKAWRAGDGLVELVLVESKGCHPDAIRM
jgi:hypothetical protein